MNTSQMNTTQLKEFVQLGQASYAEFSGLTTIQALTASLNGPFAEGEAEQFIARTRSTWAVMPLCRTCSPGKLPQLT